jgi:hypothetical protein
MKKFIAQIVTNLESNGFPEKSVSLPTEKMYESADNKGLSFNAVLDQMKIDHGIDFEIGDEKTVFTMLQVETSEVGTSESNDSAGMGGFMDGLKDLDLGSLGGGDMMKKAQEMMSKMDPKELERMKNMFMGMSEEEKEEVMQKGRDMGIK